MDSFRTRDVHLSLSSFMDPALDVCVREPSHGPVVVFVHCQRVVLKLLKREERTRREKEREKERKREREKERKREREKEREKRRESVEKTRARGGGSKRVKGGRSGGLKTVNEGNVLAFLTPATSASVRIWYLFSSATYS